MEALLHSPEALAELGDGSNAFLQYPEVLERLGSLPPVDYRSLILSSIVQAGLDRFAVLEAPVGAEGMPPSFRKRVELPLDRDALPDFVRDRVELPGYLDWLAVGHELEREIRQVIPDYHALRKDGTMRSHMFITDLLYALRHRQHIIFDMRLKDVERLSLDLPDQIGVPFRNLIRVMEPVQPDVCVPRSSIAKEQLIRFRELLASSQFREYKSNHEKIAETERSLAGSVKALSQSAQRLYETNPDIVRLRSTAVSLLPSASGTAAKALDGLPGTLVSLFAKPVTDWLKSKRRLMVYELGDLLEDIAKQRLRQAVE
jgi:hypothetical protein